MTKYFVIGDVHGKYDMLRELLTYWDGESQLVFLGDLIDRGEDSKSTLSLVRSLVIKKGAICLAGNHEHMFKAWINDPVNSYEHYRRNGGDITINSLLGRELDVTVDGLNDAEQVKKNCSDLVDFIHQLPYLFESEKYIFVHAGIDLSLADWRKTSDYEKVWIRTPFHEGKNLTGKIIIFGHTPTFYLFGENPGTEKIWRTDDGKIGIDGGAVYGGVLHALLVDDEGVQEHYLIRHDGVCLAKDD